MSARKQNLHIAARSAFGLDFIIPKRSVNGAPIMRIRLGHDAENVGYLKGSEKIQKNPGSKLLFCSCYVCLAMTLVVMHLKIGTRFFLYGIFAIHRHKAGS